MKCGVLLFFLCKECNKEFVEKSSKETTRYWEISMRASCECYRNKRDLSKRYLMPQCMIQMWCKEEGKDSEFRIYVQVLDENGSLRYMADSKEDGIDDIYNKLKSGERVIIYNSSTRKRDAKDYKPTLPPERLFENGHTPDPLLPPKEYAKRDGPCPVPGFIHHGPFGWGPANWTP